MLGNLIDVVTDPRHMTHQFGVSCMYDFLCFAFWLFDVLPQCQLAQKVDVPNSPARVFMSLNSVSVRRICMCLSLIFLVDLSSLMGDVRKVFGVKGFPLTGMPKCKETK